jgi:hypothetical protein
MCYANRMHVTACDTACKQPHLTMEKRRIRYGLEAVERT